MQLLVSVRSAIEAAAAVDGGADIVDAKDPDRGALGAVSLEVFSEIRAAIGDRRLLSAAIGDAADESAIEGTACRFARAGAAFVKVGFAGVTNPRRVAALASAASRGIASGCSGRGQLVLVAYVDETMSIAPADLVDIAAAAGAGGVLVDTAKKDDCGLLSLIGLDALSAWVTHAHARGLLAAVAGKLTFEDLSTVQGTGADIAGIRGAACDGGRNGQVSAERVRQLRTQAA
ncbi:MAG TPA: (5-formylfuran-3-yl)methyl phosphate synthase [Vicinamibacterales bacterium]|nr:(5-formylfuran-3-yl)methyl phosphate synthase [Vicinamibacterales bacterium]